MHAAHPMEHDIDAGRERADAPDIAMPLHARRLRAALLSSPRFARPTDGAARLIHLFVTHMTTKRKFALAGASLALVGIISYGLSDLAGKGTEYAQAQELVKAANIQIARIPAEMRLDIESRMKVTMDNALAEAEAAPDLRRISADELSKEPIHQDGNTFHLVNMNGKMPLSGVNVRVEGDSAVFSGTGASTASASAPENPVVSYLVYTDPEGHKVRLGLDQENVLRVRVAESSGLIDASEFFVK